MNQFLQLPELLRIICSNLEKKELLAVATTCRALCEPALDELWSHITSFAPLISCLPRKWWRKERNNWKIGNKKHSETCFLTHILTRTSVTLQRYLSYYAPRIRTFELKDLALIPSVEAFRSLQLATDWEPGALAPRALKFSWFSYDAILNSVQGDIVHGIYPYFSLFLGKDIICMEFPLISVPGTETHVAYFLAVSHRLPGLRELSLKDPINETVIDDSFMKFPWNYLEVFKASAITRAIVPYLAKLPRLTVIHVEWVFLFNPPQVEPVNGFSSLREVEYSASKEDAVAFLRLLPRTTAIERLKCHIQRATSSSMQSYVDVIPYCCDTSTLQRLDLHCSRPKFAKADSLEVDTDALDISSLFTFTGLKVLKLDLGFSIWITPDQITSIRALPNLEHLELVPKSGCVDRGIRTPRIDHTHFQAIIHGCRSLRSLGILFDTTHLTQQESIAPSTNVRTSRLERLSVGDSPICSPTRVTAFLKINCPELRVVQSYIVKLPSDGEHYRRTIKRWELVAENIAGQS